MTTYRHRTSLLCEDCAKRLLRVLRPESAAEVFVVEHVSPEKVCSSCLRPLHPEGDFGVQP